MARVVVRPQADDNLLEIAAYIARDDLAAAERLIDAIDSKFQLLANSPRLGRRRVELAPGPPILAVWELCGLLSTARGRD
jgi:toxin ParE1/3/4